MNGALHRLRRVLAAMKAGRAPAPEDAAAWSDGLHAAMFKNVPLEAALGLVGNWRADCRADEFENSIRVLEPKAVSNVRGTALDLEREIGRYAAAGYIRDRRIGKRPSGRNGALFDAIEANNGEAPHWRKLAMCLRSLKITVPNDPLRLVHAPRSSGGQQHGNHDEETSAEDSRQATHQAAARDRRSS